MKQALEELVKDSGLDPTACVLRHVTRTSRAVVAAFDSALAHSGITAHQFTVLMVLAHAGPMTVGGLAEAVGMHPSTTPRKIAPLTRRGLVRIKPGTDRRQRLIAITATGKRTLLSAYPRWAGVQREILCLFEPGAWRSLIRSLNTVRSGLTARRTSTPR